MESRENPLPLGWEGRQGHRAWWEQRWGPRAVLAHLSRPSSAEPGSGSCKLRPPCTDKDFFYTHTACDASGEVMQGHPRVAPPAPGCPRQLTRSPGRPSGCTSGQSPRSVMRSCRRQPGCHPRRSRLAARPATLALPKATAAPASPVPTASIPMALVMRPHHCLQSVTGAA